jgi:hypothetical protein
MMTKIVEDTRIESGTGRLAQFLRIERQDSDALQRAFVKHPAPRTEGNGRVVAFCRIARGHEA